jgi:hypothetical protein
MLHELIEEHVRPVFHRHLCRVRFPVHTVVSDFQRDRWGKMALHDVGHDFFMREHLPFAIGLANA